MIDDRASEILAFAAVHRFVLVDHVAALLSVERVEAERSLASLTVTGLLTRRRVMSGHPWAWQITRAGLSEIGSDLPEPQFDPCYRHDAGVVWLWLAARGGRFGELDRLLTDREMRSADQREVGDDAYGIDLPGGGVDPAVHYPDLWLGLEQGGIPMHLQLGSVAPTRLEAILTAYALDSRVAAVLYMVEGSAIGDLIAAVATRLELSRMVHVQDARFSPTEPLFAAPPSS